MIYTTEISMAIRAVKVPVDMSVDIVDYGRYLGIRFYESEWAHLSESERIKMAAYFEIIRRIIRGHGLESTLDPIFDKPGVQQLS
jgi:hypothetical protein